jgi:hypothetical protein
MLRHLGEALPLLVLAEATASPVATAGGFEARTRFDLPGRARIAPGADDVEHRSGHERPSSRTDDWGIGYG